MPLTGHVDRNVIFEHLVEYVPLSCPSRGTWIEMSCRRWLLPQPRVVPLTGHVDRNLEPIEAAGYYPMVVPLTGHVDRNSAALR